MSSKQFKVMVVPRWFTTEPEAIRALSDISEYYNDKAKYLFQHQYLIEDITKALQTFFTLEGINARYTHQIPYNNYHHLHMSKKFQKACLEKPVEEHGYLDDKLLSRMGLNVGYWSGVIKFDNEESKDEYLEILQNVHCKDCVGMATHHHALTEKHFLVGEPTPFDIEIPFTATEQHGQRVDQYTHHLNEKLLPSTEPKLIMVDGKKVGTMGIDGSVGICVWGAPKSFDKNSPFAETHTVKVICDMLIKAKDVNREVLENGQKWDSREYGANPNFAVTVTSEETVTLLDKMRLWHKLRNSKDSSLSTAHGPDLETNEIEFPPDAFDQYNRDCVRQGEIEIELINQQNILHE